MFHFEYSNPTNDYVISVNKAFLLIIISSQRKVAYVYTGPTKSFFRFPDEQQSEYIHLNRGKLYRYAGYFVAGGGMVVFILSHRRVRNKTKLLIKRFLVYIGFYFFIYCLARNRLRLSLETGCGKKWT